MLLNIVVHEEIDYFVLEELITLYSGDIYVSGEIVQLHRFAANPETLGCVL